MSKSPKSIEFYRILQKQSLQRLTRSDTRTEVYRIDRQEVPSFPPNTKDRVPYAAARVKTSVPSRGIRPILRALCEGWDKQNVRGKRVGGEQGVRQAPLPCTTDLQTGWLCPKRPKNIKFYRILQKAESSTTHPLRYANLRSIELIDRKSRLFPRTQKIGWEGRYPG